MSVVDRSSPVPLWAQIIEDLRARMMDGAFDDHFPTDEELTATYGVSRQTVREAVRRLQDEGLVVRQRGRGTSLTRPVLEQPLRALYSLALTVTGHGLAERSEVRAAERRPAAGDVANELGLRPGAAVVFLERLRFAGKDPLSLERSWLPWSTAAPLLRRDLEHGPLYEALLDACGVRVTAGTERIAPVIPPAADRRLLRMPAGTAAFLVERRAVAGDRPVELRRATVRGDRYRFVAEWP
ncbi:MAG: GntR family transcriptional regulator [Acidimicrobiales bacterium]